MSILIKGMKMPTSCSDCGQFRWSNFLQSDVCRIAEAIGGNGLFKFEEEGIAKRPSWCPLVEVPPHGRLIDADDVFHVLTSYYHHSADIQHEALKEALARVSTIIEAEEGD